MTRLPAPPLPKATKEDWGRISPYFTLIGFILGLVLYFFAKLLLYLKLPVMFSALLLLLVSYFITGSLHLDGLMDTFDGINCQDKDKKMEAMKDSRIGAYGAMAGIFVVLFKLVCYCTILINKMFFVILLAPVISRFVTVYSFTFLSHNQRSGVSSSLLLSGIKKPQDFIVNALTFLITLFIFLASCILPLASLIFVTISIFLSIIWAHWLDHHFKGHSGDTYGALIELSEVTALALAVILKKYL